jgi:predicted TPR repeat methyltransferase
MLIIESSGCPVTDRRYALAISWHERGDTASAIELLEQTREICHDWPPLYFKLGELYMESGERDKAVQTFRRYLELDIEDRQGAVIKLSLLGAMVQPKTLPAGYVESLFDQYAPRFDKALVENLSYRAPRLIAEAVSKVKPENSQGEKILDLGCGTGLASEALFKRASWLEGVDISSGMLLESESKQIFHKLKQADLADYLNDPDETGTFDIVLAADVLVYMGDLASLFVLIKKKLGKSGVFAFSVQKLAAGEYLLQADHRYAHSLIYLQTCAARAGLHISYCCEEILRQDAGEDIKGYIVVCECIKTGSITEIPAVDIGTNEMPTA